MPDNPAAVITPIIRDDVRRLTYAELAAVRGISKASAERLVRRKHWSRQRGNDGVVRVIVPLTEAAPEAPEPPQRHPVDPPRHPAPDIRPDNAAVVAAVLPAITEAIREVTNPLNVHLEKLHERANRLETMLADAITAERIAAGEASALRAELNRRREWSFRRRLLWAIRRR